MTVSRMSNGYLANGFCLCIWSNWNTAEHLQASITGYLLSISKSTKKKQPTSQTHTFFFMRRRLPYSISASVRRSFVLPCEHGNSVHHQPTCVIPYGFEKITPTCVPVCIMPIRTVKREKQHENTSNILNYARVPCAFTAEI